MKSPTLDPSATWIRGTFNWPRVSQGCSLSQQFATRTAWLLMNPQGLYLLSLSPTVQWTPNPALAMSWTDREIASRLIALALPSAGVLVSMKFRAGINSFPLRRELIHELLPETSG